MFAQGIIFVLSCDVLSKRQQEDFKQKKKKKTKKNPKEARTWYPLMENWSSVKRLCQKVARLSLGKTSTWTTVQPLPNPKKFF